jgi:hypothetical protein
MAGKVFSWTQDSRHDSYFAPLAPDVLAELAKL